jgi:fructose 1,6-bisphosphatase
MRRANRTTKPTNYPGFKEAADKTLELKLSGAGQDLLKAAFSGTLTGQE